MSNLSSLAVRLCCMGLGTRCVLVACMPVNSHLRYGREWAINFLEFLFSGGAVGIDVAINNLYQEKIWCLIVENTFTSIPEMANVLIGWRILRKLPLFCYKSKYMSKLKVPKVSSIVSRF